jgi:hypothetical protein
MFIRDFGLSFSLFVIVVPLSGFGSRVILTSYNKSGNVPSLSLL